MTATQDYRVRDARRFAENVEDELRRVPFGRPLPSLDPIEGTDASGLVYCMVRMDGRPARIVITGLWWEELGPDGIASAVLQAHQYAGEKAGLAKALLRRNGREWRTRPEDCASEPAELRFPEGRSTLEDVDRIRRSLDETSGRVRAAIRRLDMITSPVPHEISGPRGLFTVVVRGVVIASARVDTRRIRPDDGPDLADDALHALLAAHTDRRFQGES